MSEFFLLFLKVNILTYPKQFIFSCSKIIYSVSNKQCHLIQKFFSYSLTSGHSLCMADICSKVSRVLPSPFHSPLCFAQILIYYLLTSFLAFNHPLLLPLSNLLLSSPVFLKFKSAPFTSSLKLFDSLQILRKV